MNNIETLRKNRGMTRPELAQKMEVKPGTIYQWERGIRNPEITSIVRLADLFGVSLDYLMGRTGT